MPKVKSKGRPPQDESDEEISGASQAISMTQAERVLASIPTDAVEGKVNDLVQYLLIMDQKKMPIKRQDITKAVMKEHSRAFPFLIKRAAEKLNEVFAIDLVELEGKQKSYMLVNRLAVDPEKPHLEWPPEDNARMGLLMVILSVIFMSGNVVTDAKLFHVLKKFGVDSDRNHELFGDVKKMVMTEFVRQGYLECSRQPTDPPTYEFQWGQRAKNETSKKKVLEFVAAIYGNTPNQWTSQYQDAERSERGNTDAE